MKKIIYIISVLVYLIINENDLCAQVDSLVYVPLQKYELGNAETSTGHNEASVIPDRFKTESTETIQQRWNTEFNNDICSVSYSARTVDDCDTDLEILRQRRSILLEQNRN